jgi:hypothetical protein
MEDEELKKILRELLKEMSLIRKSMETMSYDISYISNLINLS